MSNTVNKCGTPIDASVGSTFNGGMNKTIILGAFLLNATATFAADELIKNAMVKIYCVQNRADYYNPWSMKGPRSSTGSGCVIGERRILTNAHVVSDQTYIQIRKYGASRRYEARVLSVSHHADLALLTVDEPGFFEGISPLDLGVLPETQQDVLVYGFPMGGDTLSTTKGVVSRIEHRTYVHSSIRLLAGQIDNAINPGNSGGPVISGGKIVGVVMQGLSGADNIGYMVPVPVVCHFLEDLEDGRYDGFPTISALLQSMENPDLKRKYNVPEGESGVLVSKVLPNSPATGILEVGDVVTHIEEYDVADDGTIEFRPNERTSVDYVEQLRQVGASLSMQILRAGKKSRVELALSRSVEADFLVALERYDVQPSYYIYGGMVFCPLTKNLLKEWGSSWFSNAPKHLTHYITDNLIETDVTEIVVLLKVLAASLNQGYHNSRMAIVEAVDGKPVNSLKDMIALIEADGAGKNFVEIVTQAGTIMVLDREKAEKEKGRILEIYRIPSDRSSDLR